MVIHSTPVFLSGFIVYTYHLPLRHDYPMSLFKLFLTGFNFFTHMSHTLLSTLVNITYLFCAPCNRHTRMTKKDKDPLYSLDSPWRPSWFLHVIDAQQLLIALTLVKRCNETPTPMS